MAEFDAILFDAGGVLVVPDPAVLGPVLAPYGAGTSHVTLVRAHYAAMAVQDAVWGEGESWRRYDEAYVDAAGVAAHERDEAATVLGLTRNAHLWRYPVPGAADVLHELNRRGVPIGVVSNAQGQIEATLRRWAVCQVGEGPGARVEVVVDSHLVGVAKPDPAIFGFALDVLGLSPGRVAYVGDSVHNDVHGAAAAGLVPLHLDPHDDHPGAPHRRLRSLRDLLDVG